MTSQVDIVNRALASIGTRSSIANLQESSAEARQANLQYDAAVEAVLQAAHWNFARKQVALTLRRDATISPPDPVPVPWSFEYDVPADCVQARYVMPQLNNAPAASATGIAPQSMGPPVMFLVSSDVDDNGNDIKVILTNQPQAILVYTRRVTNVQMFDGSFAKALEHYLGFLMAPGLTGNRATAMDAFKIADITTKNARVSNGNEGLLVIDQVPDWIRARGYLADWAWPPGSIYWQAPQNLSAIS